MTKFTSFIGEHTVEYAIVPILKGYLEQEYEYVTPIFPWISREGSNISKKLHTSDLFKIIGLYPRRPKFSDSNPNKIQFKINYQVILGAKEGLSNGIPILGGLPIARSFWELANPACLWFQLNFDENEENEFYLDFNSNSESEILNRNMLNSQHEILQYVKENAQTLDIPQAVEVFRKVKAASSNLDYYSSFSFIGGYKPMYFLLK